MQGKISVLLKLYNFHLLLTLCSISLLCPDATTLTFSKVNTWDTYWENCGNDKPKEHGFKPCLHQQQLECNCCTQSLHRSQDVGRIGKKPQLSSLQFNSGSNKVYHYFCLTHTCLLFGTKIPYLLSTSGIFCFHRYRATTEQAKCDHSNALSITLYLTTCFLFFHTSIF